VQKRDGRNAAHKTIPVSHASPIRQADNDPFGVIMVIFMMRRLGELGKYERGNTGG